MDLDHLKDAIKGRVKPIGSWAWKPSTTPGIGELLTTNIFTMFRGLILDFGFIGSVLFMLAAGVLLHWTFHSMLRNIRPVFTVAVFVFMIAYFYTSFIISALVWLNIYMAFVLLWIVLRINKRITQTGSRRSAPLTAGVAI
jgi:hypothetical protein